MQHIFALNFGDIFRRNLLELNNFIYKTQYLKCSCIKPVPVLAVCCDPRSVVGNLDQY